MFDRTGVVVHSTAPEPPLSVQAEALLAQAAADGARWSVETDSELLSGTKILDPAGVMIGGLVVVYPVTDLEVAANAMMRRLSMVAAAISVLVAIAALPAVRAGLAPAVRSLARLHEMTGRLGMRDAGPPRDSWTASTRAAPAAFGMAEIEQKLDAASFDEAEAGLAALERSWDGAPVDPAER